MKISSVQTFGAPTIGYYYRAAKEQIGQEIRSYPPDKLIGSDSEELEQYFFQKSKLPSLIVDEERQIEIDKVIKTEKYRTIFDDLAEKEIVYARITIPLQPANDIPEALKHFTQSHVIKEYTFDFDPINYTVSFETSPENIEDAINEHKILFSQRTSEIESNNKDLKCYIVQELAQRRNKIQQDNDSFEAMIQKVSIPLKRKLSPQDIQIPLHVRNQIQSITAPKSTPPKELVLTAEQLKSIIEVLDSDGKNFENTPATFSKLDEPDLRSIMLSHLNLYFPGDATGETFVGLGKADIRLKISKGQILIAECKYWRGAEELADAIDQLFLYLTWRNNYGILIIFSKNKEFSEIIEKIKEVILNHRTIKGEVSHSEQTHIVSIHTFPGDSQKQVEIHTLIYNLYNRKNERGA